MGRNQVKLLSDLAKQLNSKPRQKKRIVMSLTSAKIITPKENFTSHYSNLGKAVASSK